MPFATLLAAIRQLKPQMLWLSISHLDDQERFLASYRDFYAEAGTEVPIVVGGRALTESLRRQMEFTAYCDDLRHLESLRTL